MSNKEIVITSALRTATGSLGKSLKNIPAVDLGSAVITENLKKSKIKKNEISELIFGQVLTGGTGQNPARQAAIKSGVPAKSNNKSVGFLRHAEQLKSITFKIPSLETKTLPNFISLCTILFL